ncbi:hypothetical protein Tco_0438108 [Tanacetum coccineum]
MATAGDLDEIEEVDTNCILMENLQQASTSDGGTVEQCPATVEETRALYDSLYNKLAIEVENVNSVNQNLKETNAELTTELARYKNQEKAAKFVQDFKPLINEADESLDKQKTLEHEIDSLLRAVVS